MYLCIIHYACMQTRLLSAIIYLIIARRPKGGVRMKKYEIMYILRADLDETARNEALAKVNSILTDNGAEIVSVDEKMGLRDLAYPIDDEVKGYYVILKVNAENVALKEFDRLVKINRNVLRHLILVDEQ